MLNPTAGLLGSGHGEDPSDNRAPTRPIGRPTWTADLNACLRPNRVICVVRTDLQLTQAANRTVRNAEEP
jgi:hypothetical protein